MSILIDGVWAGCGNQSGGGCGEENVVRNGIQSSILNGGSSAFYMFAPVGRQTNAEVLSSHIEHSVQEMPGRGIVSWIIHDTYCLISVSRTERMSPFESLWLASISMIYIYVCNHFTHVFWPWWSFTMKLWVWSSSWWLLLDIHLLAVCTKGLCSKL